MNEIQKQIERNRRIKERNEKIRKENEEKLQKVLKQIKNSKFRAYWEKLNRQEVRRFWIWTFKLKSDVEKMGRDKAPFFRGIWIGTDNKNFRGPTEVTLLLNWDDGYYESRNERKVWMPEGEVKTFRVEDLDIFKREYWTVLKIGGT